MSNSFKCPYCGETYPLISENTFYNSGTYLPEKMIENGNSSYSERIDSYIYKCPTCHKAVISFSGRGELLQFDYIQVKPKSLAINFPEYVPTNIRTDYEEAYAILHLSPKASATLLRRCLQAMIQDFWGIAKGNLYEQISAIEPKVSPSQWKALNGLRKIGNIGAHMKEDSDKILVDITVDEAEKLLAFIELIIKQWYIDRHEQEELYESIATIAESK